MADWAKVLDRVFTKLRRRGLGGDPAGNDRGLAQHGVRPAPSGRAELEHSALGGGDGAIHVSPAGQGAAPQRFARIGQGGHLVGRERRRRPRTAPGSHGQQPFGRADRGLWPGGCGTIILLRITGGGSRCQRGLAQILSLGRESELQNRPRSTDLTAAMVRGRADATTSLSASPRRRLTGPARRAACSTRPRPGWAGRQGERADRDRGGQGARQQRRRQRCRSVSTGQEAFVLGSPRPMSSLPPRGTRSAAAVPLAKDRTSRSRRHPRRTSPTVPPVSTSTRQRPALTQSDDRRTPHHVLTKALHAPAHAPRGP